MKKFKLKSMGPKQILSYIAFLIAIVWTLKFIFELSNAGLNQIKSTNNETASPPPANEITLSCSWNKGHAIVQGEIINYPAGFQGTEDISIILDITNNQIVSFAGLSGIVAQSLRWSDTEISWRDVLKKTDPIAYTDYKLSRISGQLNSTFITNTAKGSTYHTYSCNKASQKF